MNIQEAAGAYDFLGKLDFIGVVGFTIAILIILIFFVSNIADKLFDDKKVKQTISVVTIFSVIICICILKFEADENIDETCKANSIKRYMLLNNENAAGYIELMQNATFSDGSYGEKKLEEIKAIVRKFPDEFVEDAIPYPNASNDKIGIILVNDKTLKLLELENEKLYPMFKAKILNFMRGSHYDVLNYKYIRENIDDRCEDDILDKMISKNSSLFISIYALHNVFDKRDLANAEGAYNSIRLNPDSIKKYISYAAPHQVEDDEKPEKF
jgi:hypothetical protein